MLRSVAARIIAEESRLNSLDAAVGDGDHGITMRLGFEAVNRKLPDMDLQAGFGKIFEECGTAFMGATGGAIGVVLGKMLMAAGRPLKDAGQVGAPEFKSMLTAMEASASNSGKVKNCDKTILDAVSGARMSLSGDEESFSEAAAKAASAAELAALNTANMVCRVGRASRLGERALGHPDPGAVSFSIILRAMSDWLAARQKSASAV